jgi:chemotaxis protein MotD
MTAIDQSVLGQPVVPKAKQAIGNDNGHGNGSAKHGKEAKSFDDLVSEAEQKLGTAIAVEDDALQTLDDTDALSTDAGQKTGADTTGRVRIATNFQQMLKASNDGRATLAAANAQQGEKLAVKSDKNADAQKTKVTDAGKDKAAISPSEQLSMLLGLTASDDADPTEGTDAAQVATAKKTKSDTSPEHAEAKSEISDKSAVSMAIDALKDAAAQVQAAAQGGHHAESKIDDDDAKSGDDTNDIVRLISKDGKGAPVDVPLVDKADDAEAPKQSSSKTDFVTVLESRRYLGFSSDTNATTLANAIKADPTWSQALQSATAAQNAIDGNTSTTVNTLKLQMNPENLGNMTASLRLKGEELTVEVKVETIEAYRHLSNDHDSILKSLKDQGFSIDQVSIQLGAPEKSSASQDGNQSSNGQDPRDSLGQNARQREENERRTGNQNFWQNNDQASSQGDLGGGSDDSDSGNIYL